MLILPHLAIAKENQDTTNEQHVTLPTLQITEKADSLSPNQSSVKADTLQKRFIRNFEDLAKRAEPGVNFNRTNQSINIRGLEKDRVLTTVDGIRVPYLEDRVRSEKGGLDTVEFNTLSKMDIIRGANGSSNGSGSLSGSVNLYTLSPDDLLTNSKNFGTLLKTDYDTADQSYGLNAALAGRFAQTSWLIQAGKRQGHELDNKGHSNLYGNKRTEPEPNDNCQNNFLIKVKQDLGNGHQLGITGEQFTKIKEIDLRANQGTIYAVNHNDNKEKVARQRVSLDYNYRTMTADSLLDEANTVFYWQHAERVNKQQAYRTRLPIGNFMRNNQLQKDMYGSAGNLNKYINFAGINQKLTLGGEWYQINAKQTANGYDACPIFTSMPSPFDPKFRLYMACSSLDTNQSDMPKTHGQQWALYLSDQIGLANERVVITPAVRYDHYKHTPQNTSNYKAGKILNASTLKTSKDSKVSGSLDIKWRLAEEATAYARWSQGFKAPDPTELYMNFINSGVGYATLGNAKLKPEESNNFELGVNLGNDQLGGSVNFFYSKYKNFIDSIAIDNTAMQDLGLSPNIFRYGVDKWQNRNKVRIYGAETTANWQFTSNWKIWSSAAWAVGKDTQSNQYLNSVAPLTAIIGLSYLHDNWGSDLSLTTAIKRNKVENDNDLKAPGYGVLDFTTYWEPHQVKGLRLQAGVFNLLDKKYWNALNVPDVRNAGTGLQPFDYYTEPGRSMRLAVTYQY